VRTGGGERDPDSCALKYGRQASGGHLAVQFISKAGLDCGSTFSTKRVSQADELELGCPALERLDVNHDLGIDRLRPGAGRKTHSNTEYRSAEQG
jgi:hypothetical protein